MKNKNQEIDTIIKGGLFDVYSLWNIEPVRAKGCTVWDTNGVEYLDLYGGHAVISIGHTHPHYTAMLKKQIENIVFYSNSVQNSLQEELSDKLGKISGYSDYSLFLCLYLLLYLFDLYPFVSIVSYNKSIFEDS